MDDYRPSDLLLIAEDVYLSLKEGGKAVATTPHESAWIRLAIAQCFIAAFHACLSRLLELEDFSKEYEEYLKNGKGNVFRFVIEKALSYFKVDDLILLYQLWVKSMFNLPPDYEATLEDLEKAVKMSSNILKELKSS